MYINNGKITLPDLALIINALYASIQYIVKWHTTKYGDPYSEFVLCIWPIQSAHTHSSEHTHTVNTHTRSSGQPFMLRRPGSASRGIEGGESAVHSLPSVCTVPRLELATFRLRVRLSNH